MKARVLFILTASLLALNLSAQTAGTLVTNGLNLLAAKDLVGAYSDFSQALSLSPSNPDANVLAAATRILVLPSQPAGSNFCNRLGLPTAGRDLYDWTAKFPKDVNGNTVLPSNFTSDEVIAFFTTTAMPAIAASLANLANITNTNYTLTLTASQTSGNNVTLDYGDIMLLRAFLNAANFLGHTLNADNFSVVINTLNALKQADDLTIQQVLSDYPSLLTSASPSQLALSKADFTNGIACYFAASDFIRARAPGLERLFELSPDELGKEASFRDAATKALASLSQPVVVSTNQHDFSVQSVYAGAYFSGAKSPRSLLPQFNGSKYVNNSLPDYTFGGILLGEPACDTEALLRKKLNPTLGGVYVGSFDNGQNGGFILFVGADNQAALLGQVSDQSLPNGGQGLFAQFTVAQDGSWSFNADGCTASGQVNKDGTVNGTLLTPGNTYVSFESFWLQGDRSSDNTMFPNLGFYSGNWTGGGQSGPLYCIVDAEGRFGYVVLNPANAPMDGGSGMVPPGTTSFSSMSFLGTVVTGQYSNTTPPSITGTLTNIANSTSGTFSMTRTGVVTSDTAPTVAPLPLKTLVQYGQNATFTAQAAGSPPLCYQWYSNNVVLSGATASSLVVNNVQAQANGTVYSVLVRNTVGTSSASSILTAVPVLLPPGPITQLSPAGSLAFASTQLYTWETDTNATYYELYVLLNGSLFVDKWYALGDLTVVDGTNLAVNINGHANGSYQWFVRGYGPGGLGPWSKQPMNFTLGISGAVTLLTPANNAVLSSRHPALTWSQSFPAATWFQLYLTHNGSTYLDQWIQGSTNWTPAADLPSGSYSWWVQTYNSGGLGAWSTKSTFMIQSCVPSTIVLISPTGTPTASSTQRYTWAADPCATWYELYVVQSGKVLCDKWFTLSDSVAQSGSGNFAVDVGGHTGGNYQWYVRGWSPDGLGPWSGAGSYTTQPVQPPGQVTLLTPTNNAVLSNREPAFTWTASSPAADWYDVYVVRNGSKYAEQWVEGTTNWVPASGLPGGSYTWYVHPWNAVGYGLWSTNFSFTIPTAVPVMLTLVSPSGVAAGSTQLYTWKADAAATWYELYVARNGGAFCDNWYTLTNSVVDSATGNFGVDVSGHTSGSYQWWVRGWGPDGLGPWSSSLTFQVP